MSFPINIMPWISFLTYSHENAYLIEITKYSDIYDISTSLKNMGYEESDLAMSIYMMIVFGFVFRISAFISLVCVKPSSYVNLIMNATQNYCSTGLGHAVKWVKNRMKSKSESDLENAQVF